ncbi:Phage portal protein, SPP1 Gp6-like [Corynebacterium kalinowskii]|uniref:Phage portal protein, SPP1 Gp6-like n=1 Tax=Corynebacterium kalinowskii TaxID=2675216 RepID=A0A6B8W0I0_9CORY|nr:phage portal protein [Corynebacterium kalinowskii]QGU03110.1 Phage portal protein, SPP1 Gp6-like [Corynebacterium kalinowskii]
MNEKQVLDAARMLLDQHGSERARFDKIDAAMRPWTDEDASQRFDIQRENGSNAKMTRRLVGLAKDSQALFLPLVLDTFSQSMKVDNYFSGNQETARAWQHWQRNSMDAAQTGITRAAMQYGASFAVVTSSDPKGNEISPVISGVSPRQMTAVYGEAHAWPGESGVSSEWPIIALEIKGNRLKLYDEEAVYYLGAHKLPIDPLAWKEKEFSGLSNLKLIERREHRAGAAPVVRFRDRWLLNGEYHGGMIEPLMGLQARIDRTAYEMGITQYVAAFKQRYVVGWAPDSDYEGLKMKAQDTWFINADGAKTKIGQFDESDLTRYIDSRQASVRDLAAIAQVPAQSLGANAISNISADGLAAMESAKDRKAAEIQTSLGESYEQLLRLCAHVSGDTEEAADFGAEVKWRDATARSFAQTVDGLGKLATMLGVPPEALWEDIPGFTSERIARIKEKYSNRLVPPATDPGGAAPGIF